MDDCKEDIFIATLRPIKFVIILLDSNVLKMKVILRLNATGTY